jgi:hypothetical protein
LTRQVPLSWHTSDVSFLIKGRSNCCLDIFWILKQSGINCYPWYCGVWQKHDQANVWHHSWL